MDDWKLRLRRAREAKQLKKTTFAKLVGVSNATATDWEKLVEDGGIHEISAIRLSQVCKVLNVSPDWLLHGTEPTPSKSAQLSDKLSQDEAELLLVYRLAADPDKAFLLGAANAIKHRMIIAGTWEGPQLAARA